MGQGENLCHQTEANWASGKIIAAFESVKQLCDHRKVPLLLGPWSFLTYKMKGALDDIQVLSGFNMLEFQKRGKTYSEPHFLLNRTKLELRGR